MIIGPCCSLKFTGKKNNHAVIAKNTQKTQTVPLLLTRVCFQKKPEDHGFIKIYTSIPYRK